MPYQTSPSRSVHEAREFSAWKLADRSDDKQTLCSWIDVVMRAFNRHDEISRVHAGSPGASTLLLASLAKVFEKQAGPDEGYLIYNAPVEKQFGGRIKQGTWDRFREFYFETIAPRLARSAAQNVPPIMFSRNTWTHGDVVYLLWYQVPAGTSGSVGAPVDGAKEQLEACLSERPSVTHPAECGSTGHGEVADEAAGRLEESTRRVDAGVQQQLASQTPDSRPNCASPESTYGQATTANFDGANSTDCARDHATRKTQPADGGMNSSSTPKSQQPLPSRRPGAIEFAVLADTVVTPLSKAIPGTMVALVAALLLGGLISGAFDRIDLLLERFLRFFSIDWWTLR